MEEADIAHLEEDLTDTVSVDDHTMASVEGGIAIGSELNRYTPTEQGRSKKRDSEGKKRGILARAKDVMRVFTLITEFIPRDKGAL